MKTPITPDEIREGETIRVEYHGGHPHMRAAEYVAGGDGDIGIAVRDPGSWSLFRIAEAPKPPVELPEAPTLGWITYQADPSEPSGQFLGVFEIAGGGDLMAVDSSGDERVDIRRVTAFTPATPVPSSAWEQFVTGHHGFYSEPHQCSQFPYHPVCRLIAAVEAANGGQS